MNHDGEIDIYLGLDVGKGEHHGTALTPAGKKVFDKPMPNSESRLRDLFEKLQAKHGNVLVVVDQPASMGALPLAVARDTGCRVAHLPGLTMRRIADLYPGESKTDARDAAIIADAARTMPHTLRDLAPDDETVAEPYPALLVTTGLWDSQVQYYEPAKWVARLQAKTTGTAPILLVTNMEAGHGGKSGRFRRLEEEARNYAFVLQVLGRLE